jgi:hypothetical protein
MRILCSPLHGTAMMYDYEIRTFEDKVPRGIFGPNY